MVAFISGLIPNQVLATIIMSILPLIELKGGIVYAMGVGLGFFESLGLAYLGSTIAFFPVFLLLIPILNLLKKIKLVNKIALKVESYFVDKAQTALKEQENSKSGKKLTEKGLKMLSVFVFVAIPLPMTGVWTGTAIAVFLGLKLKEAILPVFAGNLVAGLIIATLALICKTFWSIALLDYILYGLFALAVLLLVVVVVKVLIKKPKKEEGQ